MRSRINILVWIVIGLMLLGTGAWTVWATRQPRMHSIWAPGVDDTLPP